MIKFTVSRFAMPPHGRKTKGKQYLHARTIVESNQQTNLKCSLRALAVAQLESVGRRTEMGEQ